MIISKEPILEVSDLSVSFSMYKKGLEKKLLKVISDLNLTVYPGEILAVAGSSGSGKSLLASAVLGILPDNAIVGGSMRYCGQPLTRQSQKMLRGKEIALVPQSVSYLDPLMKVGRQADGYQKTCPIQKRRTLFRRLELPEKTEKLYPFQLSGGMARRVLVSTAILSGARLIIADEPTPGMSLDQARAALQIFRKLADEGAGVLLITHDIDLAFDFADRIAVFYGGTTVESAPAKSFRCGPEALHHPYSRALWRALPQNGFIPIPGSQPYAGSIPEGCLFASRCPFATEQCHLTVPPVRQVEGGEVRCFYETVG